MDLYFPSLAPKYVILRTSSDASSLAGAVQRELQAIDRGLAIADVRTMDQIVEQSAYARRWTTGLLGAFAGLALILALVGIYGVTSWAVAQRTPEIGIRMALGASRGQVLRMVIGYGARLCAIGLAIGLAAGLALRGLLSSLTFGVSTADPWVYGGAGLLMMVAALAACYVPARRACRVDPLVALRWD
jgi:ABC-type antimicrobial peptide transport system permease subunit